MNTDTSSEKIYKWKKKHMKRYSTAYVIKELTFKAMGYQPHLFRRLKFKILTSRDDEKNSCPLEKETQNGVATSDTK